MPSSSDWDAFLNMSWADYQLESDPSMAYFSSGAFSPGQGVGPAQQQYWQGQSGNIWNQYQGVLGTELRQGAETPTTFVDFLEGTPWTERYSSLSPTLRPGGGSRRYNPTTRYMYR